MTMELSGHDIWNKKPEFSKFRQWAEAKEKEGFSAITSNANMIAGLSKFTENNTLFY